jgi:hypothetical protein
MGRQRIAKDIAQKLGRWHLSSVVFTDCRAPVAISGATPSSPWRHCGRFIRWALILAATRARILTDQTSTPEVLRRSAVRRAAA